MDPMILRPFIKYQTFLANLLNLFQSEDTRERDDLKKITTGYTPGRAQAVFDESVDTYAQAQGMLVYHRKLAYCISQFVQKEPMLGGVVVREVLRSWPITNCQKEVLLIGELEEIVENINPEQYRKLAFPICARRTKCSNSWNSQVAERALYAWNNEQFVKIVSQAMEEVFPVVVEGIEKNLKRHWSKSVRQLTENVKIMVEEMDPVLYFKGVQQLVLWAIKARQEELLRK